MPDIRPIESLRFDNVSYSHSGGMELFSDLHFDFPMNTICNLSGVSGAGRSSLLQLMAGIAFPTTGNFFINGENVTEMTFEEFLCLRLNIGYAFDMGGLIVNRTLEQNLMLPLMYHQILSEAEAKERVDESLAALGIYNQKNERPAHVSGGTRKTCCILRAMILNPDVLLLDDPTVGLNRDSTQLLVAFMEKRMAQGFNKHIFMTSHDDRFLDCFDHVTIRIHEKQLQIQRNIENGVVNL